MPNSRQTSVIASPSSRRPTKHRRSSITELSFHGINTSRPKAKSVTHVSGTICHLCLRPYRGTLVGSLSRFAALCRTTLSGLVRRRPPSQVCARAWCAFPDQVTGVRPSDINCRVGHVAVGCMRSELERPESSIRDTSMAVRLPALRFAHLRLPRPTLVLPVLLALLALLLRLHGLSDKPLWYDEILSLNRARLPLADLVIDALKHKHYPTYFLLLRSFASAHIDPWMLRLPSALVGAGCAFLVAKVATDIRGELAGVVAGLLMALSPLEVQYGQEARAYALISCL